MNMRKLVQIKEKGHFQTLFYIIFFSPLLGISGLWYIIMSFAIAYGVIVRKHRKIGCIGLVLSLFFITISTLKLFHFYDVSFWFPTIKYYMGWGIVICFFYIYNISINVNKLIIITSIEIIIEFLLINTILPANFLPNYPDLDYLITNGSLARVYSIGCNASNTATIIVILLSYREILKRNGCIIKNKKIIDTLPCISIILLGSGVGFLLFVVYLFFKYKLLTVRHIIIGFLSIWAFVLFSKSITMNQDSIFQRISYEYIEFIWEYKQNQIDDLIREYHIKNQLLGSNFRGVDNPVIWGDFAWLEYYISVGLLGIVLFMLIICKYINKLNSFPIIIGILGALHYGGIFSLPGQMVFAYALLLNRKTLLFYSIQK